MYNAVYAAKNCPCFSFICTVFMPWSSSAIDHFSVWHPIPAVAVLCYLCLIALMYCYITFTYCSLFRAIHWSAAACCLSACEHSFSIECCMPGWLCFVVQFCLTWAISLQRHMAKLALLSIRWKQIRTSRTPCRTCGSWNGSGATLLTNRPAPA